MRKKWIIGIGCILLLAAAFCLFANRYTLVNSRLYRKDIQSLDLRGQNVSLEEIEALMEKLPETDIQWDIPFQGGAIPGDAEEVAIDSLTIEEAEVLATLSRLRSVRAENCRDYEALMYLKQLRPDVQIRYQVSLNGKTFASTASELSLSGIEEEEISLLSYLPEVHTVTLSGGEPEVLVKLKNHCNTAGIRLQIQVCGEILPEDATTLTLHEAGNNDVALLHLATGLKNLHFTEPAADGEKLVALADALDNTTVSWEKTVFGLSFAHDATEIDLTKAIALGDGEVLGDKTAYQHGLDYPILGTEEETRSAIKVLKYHPLPDKTENTADLIAAAEAAMAYFPEAEKLVMCGSILDNESMSQFREAHRDTYKVVWSVLCGEIAPRTDAKLFMPTKYHVYYFFDKDTPNLKYCEEVVSMDIGHMLVQDLSFVEYMPNLKYLILTLSDVREITPLSSCKNLVFLEMDWTRVTDYSPLLGCTALEDLNIGETYGDITPVLEMTWLKNLWLVGCGNKKIHKAMEAMPDTHIGAFYDNPDDGWRQLPNYYKMRDALLMYYML